MIDYLWKIPITVNPNLKEDEVLFSKDGKWFDAAIMLKNAREENEKLRAQLEIAKEALEWCIKNGNSYACGCKENSQFVLEKMDKLK